MMGLRFQVSGLPAVCVAEAVPLRMRIPDFKPAARPYFVVRREVQHKHNESELTLSIPPSIFSPPHRSPSSKSTRRFSHSQFLQEVSSACMRLHRQNQVGHAAERIRLIPIIYSTSL